MRIFEVDAACSDCAQTGLYKGMGEGQGIAVVCSRCKGTGKAHLKLQWEDFTGRKERQDVSRVLLTNPGIGAGRGNGYSEEDFGGISYSDWLAGKKFGKGTEMRRFVCPAWWYQSADYSRKPDWKECGWGAFSSCEHFHQKDKCWQRFDAEKK